MAKKTINKKVKKIVQQYIKTLENENFSVERVYVFGSYAKQQAHSDSDVDVAIVSSEWNSSIDMAQYLLAKAHDIYDGDLFIEPHGLNPQDFTKTSALAWEIQKTGIRIK